jgi:hypothetical protein
VSDDEPSDEHVPDDDWADEEEPPPEVAEVMRATAKRRRKQGGKLIGGGVLAVVIFVGMWINTEGLTEIGTGLKADVTVALTWGSLLTALLLAGFGVSLLIHTAVALEA